MLTHKILGSGLIALAASFLINTASLAQSDTDFFTSHIAATSGNPDSDHVFLWLQGGPNIQPDTDVIGPEGLPSIAGESVFFVLPYQVQTQYPERFNTKEISFEEAKEGAATSVQIVNETIDFFHEDGKQVYILSASYGAFVAIDQIAKYGNTAESYVIIVGRLDMPDDVWSSFSNGDPMKFLGGTNFVPATIDEAGMGTGTVIGDQNMMRLAAGLGYKRYTQILGDTDLSNVTYVTAIQDEQVGVLTQSEIDFLQQHGATVITVDTGHGDALESPEVFQVLQELFASN